MNFIIGVLLGFAICSVITYSMLKKKAGANMAPAIDSDGGIYWRWADEDAPTMKAPTMKAPNLDAPISLRDYFASHASENDVWRFRFEYPDGTEREEPLTVEASKWKYADAMLAEREKGADDTDNPIVTMSIKRTDERSTPNEP